MFWRPRAFRLLLLTLVLLAACAPPKMAPQAQFEITRRDFAERLRWGDFAGAARHLAPPQREDFQRRFADSPDLHITDVRLESAEAGDGGRQVVTWSTIEYYLLPSTTVKTFRFRQEWEYSGDGRFNRATGWQWVLFPTFPESLRVCRKMARAGEIDSPFRTLNSRSRDLRRQISP